MLSLPARDPPGDFARFPGPSPIVTGRPFGETSGRARGAPDVPRASRITRRCSLCWTTRWSAAAPMSGSTGSLSAEVAYSSHAPGRLKRLVHARGRPISRMAARHSLTLAAFSASQRTGGRADSGRNFIGMHGAGARRGTSLHTRPWSRTSSGPSHDCRAEHARSGPSWRHAVPGAASR